MAESVYKVIEIVGTSTESWDKAAAAAVRAQDPACATCVSPKSPTWTCSWAARRSSIARS